MNLDEPDPDPLGIVPILFFILVLILINAFFAAAEMAVVSVKKSKLQIYLDKGDKRAILLEKLTKEPVKFLSTIQVAITLAGFLSSAIAGSKISEPLVALFASIGVKISEIVAVIIVTVILSYITLVFGELFPKRVALKKPIKIALFSARTVNFVMIVTKPFVKLLSASTNFLLKITGNNNLTSDERISEEEIKSLILAGHTEGLINEQERQMLESIFKFDDLTADAIMTPRTDVFAIDIEDSMDEHIDEIINEGYTRIPVYEEDIDNVIGILHVKDLFKEAKENGFENIDIKKILRKPYFVPLFIKIDILFKNMKATNNHIAILIDEHGGSAGIVTLEDLVEEIVGNIYDEYDEVDKTIQTIDDRTYLVDAGIPIQELNRRIKLNLEEHNEEFDTLGGLIIYILGYIPTPEFDREIEFENLTFKINKIDANRIEEVLLTIHTAEEMKEKYPDEDEE